MVVFVISFVTFLQRWISDRHVTEIITMEDIKFNYQLKFRNFQGCFSSLSFYSLFCNQTFVWGHFSPPGYNGVIVVLIIEFW